MQGQGETDAPAAGRCAQRWKGGVETADSGIHLVSWWGIRRLGSDGPRSPNFCFAATRQEGTYDVCVRVTLLVFCPGWMLSSNGHIRDITGGQGLRVVGVMAWCGQCGWGTSVGLEEKISVHCGGCGEILSNGLCDKGHTYGRCFYCRSEAPGRESVARTAGPVEREVRA